MSHLVVMAAGTGGHIIPGLAVAREMQRRGWTVSWLGTRHGMENRLVPPSGIEMDTVDFAGLRGKGWRHTLTGLFKLLAAFAQCGRVLRQRGTHVVLGMGGYVCFPGGLMAALLRRPLVLVNADAALLLSNKALMPLAKRVLFGFEGPVSERVAKGQVTGNPVREAIESMAPPQTRWADRTGPLNVLVLGGSLGARVLNEVVPAALAALPEKSRPRVLHQAGAAHADQVRQVYEEHQVTADVRPFIDDMAQALADCDVVICRAGAVTVSELCAAGVPAVLVPLVVSTTSHQKDNAAWMARHGAAVHLPQDELTAQSLSELMQSWSRSQLLGMAQCARALARPHAAQRVADELERWVRA